MLTSDKAMPRSAKPLLVAPAPDFTLGARNINASAFRPFNGNSLMRLFSITSPMVPLAVSTSGASPVTSTFSCTLPTVSCRLISARWST